MSDYPMLISNKLHSFRNFRAQIYENKQHLKINGALNVHIFAIKKAPPHKNGAVLYYITV